MSVKLAEILRGCTTGPIQRVGIMQVIPLVSETSDDRFVSPNQGVKFKTTDYGTVNFNNPTDKTLIVPMNASYVVEQSAQDHAMSQAGLVKKKSTKRYTDARCIQSTQGGTITEDNHKMVLLPFPLREAAFKTRGTVGMDMLWNTIGTFNRQMGVSGSSQHLEYFLKQFEKELNEFNSEFEPIPNQVGAIVLVNGEIVGIERTPGHDYFLSIWSALIRECYGSLAIYEAKTKVIPEGQLYERFNFGKNVNSIEQLEAELNRVANAEDEATKAVVRELMDVDFKIKDENHAFDSLTIQSIEEKSARFTGQIIRDTAQVVYASLFVTARWTASAKEWRKGTAFTI